MRPSRIASGCARFGSRYPSVPSPRSAAHWQEEWQRWAWRAKGKRHPRTRTLAIDAGSVGGRTAAAQPFLRPCRRESSRSPCRSTSCSRSGGGQRRRRRRGSSDGEQPASGLDGYLAPASPRALGALAPARALARMPRGTMRAHGESPARPARSACKRRACPGRRAAIGRRRCVDVRPSARMVKIVPLQMIRPSGS